MKAPGHPVLHGILRLDLAAVSQRLMAAPMNAGLNGSEAAAASLAAKNYDTMAMLAVSNQNARILVVVEAPTV